MYLPFGESAGKTQSQFGRAGVRVLFIFICLVLAAGFIAPKDAGAISCGFGSNIGGNTCQGFITDTAQTTWTVPGDWNSASNTIELIGGGGNGAAGSGGGPGGTGNGGGGAYYRAFQSS
jgi:hypothetical protein